MISAKAICLAIAAALLLGFGGGVTVEGWRAAAQTQKSRAELAEAKTDFKEALLRASAAAMQTYTRMEADKDVAIKNAVALASRNGADADAARRERDGLRHDLAGVPARIAAASDAAVREYAAAATVVFEQCTARYVAVAEKADGHAADVRLMIEAWPKAAAKAQ